jgi:ferredoxin-NADP reductase/Na+-translocating ferredoxin:NAD+ oxidoreductase RnfD subunit
MLSSIKNLSMYALMSYFLFSLIGLSVILSLAGILAYPWWHILGSGIVLTIAAVIFNWILARLFKVKTNPESQFITAWILTLIVGPYNPLEHFWILVGIAALAQASKYILAYKKKHIFNPAAAGVLASFFLLNQGASWWVGGKYTLPVVIIGGLLLARKIRRLHLVLSFLITYVLLILTQTTSLSFLIYSSLFFFAFVMLVEPLTSPAGKKYRVFYGIFIALALFLLQTFTVLPYTLELALLAGNFTFWMFKSRKERITVKFIERVPRAKNIYSFWFEPIKKINFIPGQFLEWTLAHDKHDNRGVRRWFTITASPTEDKIMLTTKLAEKSSTFKSALNSLAPGDEIVISDPDGEFILPSDPNKKLVFIAGGIGITPYRSIVKYLLDTNQSRDIILMYSARSTDEFTFKDLWEEAQKKFGLKPVYVATDEKGPPASQARALRAGYINPEMIKQEVPDWTDRLFYVSGPEPMVEAFEKMLLNMGIADKNIIRDYFPGYTETYA